MRLGSRRAFLAGAAVVVALPATSVHAGEGQQIRLMTTYVAGLGRYAPVTPTMRLAEEEAVVLLREPENRYDGRAVSLRTAAGEKLVYVPRPVLITKLSPTSWTQSLLCERASLRLRKDAGARD